MKCVFMWGQLGSFSLARLGRLRGIELSGARQAGQEHAVAPGSRGSVAGMRWPVCTADPRPGRPRAAPLLALPLLAQEASETFRW